MKFRIYEYPKCSTCRKALKFLEAHNIRYESRNIVECPPSMEELSQMLHFQNGEIKKLFNTSGELYREMKLGQKLAQFSVQEAITLLSQHGKLIKRPFLLGPSVGLLGFSDEHWRDVLVKNK